MKAAILGLLGSVLATVAAGAADIKVLTAGAFKPVVLALAPGFEAATGHRLVVENDTAGALSRRIGGGEAFDVAVLTPALVKELTAAGRLAPGSGQDIARVGIGVAVKADAPAPDIATVEGFKAALLAAPSVAVIDPKSGGSSGIYLAGLFDKLGIAGALAPKLVLVNGGLVAERVAKGEATLAVHQISEILPVAGVRLVGPLPEAVQNYTIYSGAIGASARDAAAAGAFLATLTGANAAAVLTAKGMEPAK